MDYKYFMQKCLAHFSLTIVTDIPLIVNNQSFTQLNGSYGRFSHVWRTRHWFCNCIVECSVMSFVHLLLIFCVKPEWCFNAFSKENTFWRKVTAASLVMSLVDNFESVAAISKKWNCFGSKSFLKINIGVFFLCFFFDNYTSLNC